MAQCTCPRHIHVRWALIVVQHSKGIVPRQLLACQVCTPQHLLQRRFPSLHLHKVVMMSGGLQRWAPHCMLHNDVPRAHAHCLDQGCQ